MHSFRLNWSGVQRVSRLGAVRVSLKTQGKNGLLREFQFTDARAFSSWKWHVHWKKAKPVKVRRLRTQLQTNQWFTLLETFYRLRRKKMILKVTFPPSDRYSKRKKEQKKKYYSAPRNRINKRHICVQSSFLLERNFFFCARICLSFSCNYWFIL